MVFQLLSTVMLRANWPLGGNISPAVWLHLWTGFSGRLSFSTESLCCVTSVHIAPPSATCVEVMQTYIPRSHPRRWDDPGLLQLHVSDKWSAFLSQCNILWRKIVIFVKDNTIRDCVSSASHNVIYFHTNFLSNIEYFIFQIRLFKSSPVNLPCSWTNRSLTYF